MTLTTLADVRTLLGHLPKESCAKSTFQHVVSCLAEAARSGETIDVSVALRIVLQMKGVDCRPKV
jgi:hypothetical protein